MLVLMYALPPRKGIVKGKPSCHVRNNRSAMQWKLRHGDARQYGKQEFKMTTSPGDDTGLSKRHESMILHHS